MSDDLTQIATWAGALLHKLEPPQRRAILAKVAQDLRRSQSHRIASQTAPDSTPYTPRKSRKKLKDKKGRIKQQKAAMFTKLKTTKYLKTGQDAQQLTVGFYGRVARIARVHQEGLTDKVSKKGTEYRYPERRLLGFSVIDYQIIQTILLQSLLR